MTARLRLFALASTLAVALSAAAAASAGHGVTTHCRQAGSVCHAVVSLAGGASNKHIQVLLPGHFHWAHPTVRPDRSDLVGAYTLSGGHFNGSSYYVTLSAVGSIRHGELVFTFHRLT